MHSQRKVLLDLPKTQALDIRFQDVRYAVSVGHKKAKKEILKGVDGCFKSGELTVIMGPSGAGKSSLLNILTGFQKHNVQGEITFGSAKGQSYNWKEYKKQSCYIQQDDMLHPMFTVNEVMHMAAEFKLGNNLNKKGKTMIVDDVLELLDLTKAKATRCDRLSGGQRKRLSIALELVDNPPVMFLDEPTTGLDSRSTTECVSLLLNLSRGGRTIVCTIHQPSAITYEMFDHVYLLAAGRCVYQGDSRNTVAYFSSCGLVCPKYHNPADYMIEVASMEYGNFSDLLSRAAKDTIWRSTGGTRKPPLFHSNSVSKFLSGNKTLVLINPPSELLKFRILLKRCYIQLFRDWTVTHLKLGLHILVGILIGLNYTDAGRDGSKTVSNAGYLLVSCVYLSYTSLMPAILKFPSELPVLRKENFNNWYKLSTYYIAFLIINTPLQVLFATVYTSVSYVISSQPLEWFRYLMFVAISVLVTLVAESIGLVLGSTLAPINGTFIGSISLCAILLFGGFLVLFNHMPVFLTYLTYLSFMRYAFEALVLAVYGYNREKLPCPVIEGKVEYCHFRYPELIMNELAIKEGNYLFDVVMLVVNILVFRMLAYCTLKRTLSHA